MKESWVQSLGGEDPVEEEIATHSSILAWKTPWTEEPGRLQSLRSQRVKHDWVTEHRCTHPTPHTYTWCKYSIHSHFQARNVTSLNVELEEMDKFNLRGYMIWLPHTTCFLFCLEDITNIHTDESTQMHIKARWICRSWYIT